MKKGFLGVRRSGRRCEDEEEGGSSEEVGGMATPSRDKEVVVAPPPLPPRYRFRDLILGDYAFNDDGERWVEMSRKIESGKKLSKFLIL